MMEKQLLCFDVDGTLQDNATHEVLPSTIEALKKLKALGHYIIISTGRGFDSLKRTHLFNQIKFDGYVINNGQLLLDKDLNVLKEEVMNPKSVLELIEKANKINMPVTLKMKKRIITLPPNQYVYETQKYFNNIIPEVGTYNGKDEVYALCLFEKPGFDYHYFDGIEGITIYPGKTTYADGVISHISKATGNQYFVQLFQTDGYIAFGDSQNDLEMFESSKLAICMNDGDEVAKKKADYITDDCSKDGILKACKYFNYWG